MAKEYHIEGKIRHDCSGIDFTLPTGFYQYLDPLKDKDLVITLRRHLKKRSNGQNRFYWGVIIPYIKMWHFNNTGVKLEREWLHEYILQSVMSYKPMMKSLFEGIEGLESETYIYVIEDVETGEVRRPKRSSDMSTIEFTEMWEKIQSHFSKVDPDFNLPKPTKNNLLSDLIKMNNEINNRRINNNPL